MAGKQKTVAFVAAILASVPGNALAGPCDPAGLSAAPGNSAALIETGISRVEGTSLVRAKLPEGRRYVVMAFGARWCGPCHVFTRQTRPIVEGGDDAARSYTYVFASLDRSRSQALAYAREERMPWPILAPDMVERRPAIARLAGRRVPALVVFDLTTSQIVCSSNQGRDQFGAWQTFQAFQAMME